MNNALYSFYQQRGVLTAAHRGTVGGNIIQNSYGSFVNALQHQADIVEIDVTISKDGILFPFHHQTEPFLFGRDIDITQLNASEIETLECLNGLGQPSGQFLEPLAQLMAKTATSDALINFDRAWLAWPETLAFIKQHQLTSKVIVKSPVEKSYLDLLATNYSDIMYMPIIRTIDDYQAILHYSLHLVACELIFETIQSPLLELIPSLKEKQILAWVNAINLGREYNLSAFLDDNNAILNGYARNWGQLIDYGFDVIQTDWPFLLKSYIKERNGL